MGIAPREISTVVPQYKPQNVYTAPHFILYKALLSVPENGVVWRGARLARYRKQSAPLWEVTYLQGTAAVIGRKQAAEVKKAQN